MQNKKHVYEIKIALLFTRKGKLFLYNLHHYLAVYQHHKDSAKVVFNVLIYT